MKLSNRQEQIMALMVNEGLRYKEIAARLGICLSTVDNYVSRIREKFRVQNTAQAVALYSVMRLSNSLPSKSSRKSRQRV